MDINYPLCDKRIFSTKKVGIKHRASKCACVKIWTNAGYLGWIKILRESDSDTERP